MTRYRVGGHWGVTIVEVGDGPMLADGHREGDRLVAVPQDGSGSIGLAFTPDRQRR